jgi:hypothetical protein
MYRRDSDQWILLEEWGRYDYPTDAALNGYVECACCGDFFASSELSALGYCPYCATELDEVEKLP